MKNKLEKNELLNILEEFFGLNDEWQQGTYFYNLIRVKNSNLTVNDFEEMEYSQIEELAEIILEKFKLKEEPSDRKKD